MKIYKITRDIGCALNQPYNNIKLKQQHMRTSELSEQVYFLSFLSRHIFLTTIRLFTKFVRSFEVWLPDRMTPLSGGITNLSGLKDFGRDK